MTRVFTLAALGAALLVTGCGGDDEPSATTSPTTTTTATEARTTAGTTLAKPPATQEKAGGFDTKQTVTDESAAKPKGPPPDKACIEIVAGVTLSGDLKKRAATAAAAEKEMGRVVDRAAGPSGPLHELALAHALLAQLYGGAAGSADQAQKLKPAIIALETRTTRLAAGADAPACALGKSIF